MDEEVRSSQSRSCVMLEGYLGDGSKAREVIMSRTKSLTHDDLDELKGYLDLGFGFNYDKITELYNTLPALELCYSMSQRFLDDQQQNRSAEDGEDRASWRVSRPGDDPDEVKARLIYWVKQWHAPLSSATEHGANLEENGI